MIKLLVFGIIGILEVLFGLFVVFRDASLMTRFAFFLVIAATLSLFILTSMRIVERSEGTSN